MEKKLSTLKVNDLAILRNETISFKAYESQIIVIMGKNGSGKNKLVENISGIYEPESLSCLSLYDIPNC